MSKLTAAFRVASAAQVSLQEQRAIQAAADFDAYQAGLERHEALIDACASVFPSASRRLRAEAVTSRRAVKLAHDGGAEYQKVLNDLEWCCMDAAQTTRIAALKAALG